MLRHLASQPHHVRMLFLPAREMVVRTALSALRMVLAFMLLRPVPVSGVAVGNAPLLLPRGMLLMVLVACRVVHA